MSVWDDPALAQGGDYVSFERLGDYVSGIVNVVRTQTFKDNVAPQLLLTVDQGGAHSTDKLQAERQFQPGDDCTVTAGQIRLKLALAAERPEAGDHVFIRLDSIEPRGEGKTLKHFTVQVTKGVRPPQQPEQQGYQGQPQQPAAPTYQQPAPQPQYQAPQQPAAPAYTPAAAPVQQQPGYPPQQPQATGYYDPTQQPQAAMQPEQVAQQLGAAPVAPPQQYAQPQPAAPVAPPQQYAQPQPAAPVQQPQAAPQPGQGPPMDNAAAAAAIANLTPEQRQQLGLPPA